MFNDKDRSKLGQKVLDNEFETNDSLTELYITIDNEDYTLSDEEVKELFLGSNIEYWAKRKKGKTAEEYKAETGSYDGFKIFKAEERSDFIVGNIVEDPTSHGMSFAICESEIFELILKSSYEDFGSSLAIISFEKPDGSIIEDAFIRSDVKPTYRCSKRFCIKDVKSLNDYKLIMSMFKCSNNEGKNLLYGFYEQSIDYYTKRNCLEIVKALRDIRNDIVI